MSQKPEKGKGKKALQFVTIDPSSSGGRSDTRRIVRSHAGGWMWRQLQAARENSEADYEEDLLEPGPSTIEENEDLDRPTPSAEKSSASVAGSQSESQVPKVSGRERIQRKRNKRAHMELSRVSCDKLDPFQCYISSSPLSSGLVSNSNKYCKIPQRFFSPRQLLTCLTRSIGAMAWSDA